MMKTVNLSLKIPEDAHQKFKVYSFLVGKSMSEIMVDYIKTLEVQMPKLKGKSKPKKEKGNTPVKKSRTKDDSQTKERIIALNAEGLSLGEIGKKLEAEGIKTATGNTSWQKTVISRMLKRWGIEPANQQKTAS